MRLNLPPLFRIETASGKTQYGKFEIRQYLDLLLIPIVKAVIIQFVQTPLVFVVHIFRFVDFQNHHQELIQPGDFLLQLLFRPSPFYLHFGR